MYNCNFVFFWGKEDYYRVAFADILNLDNVKYICRLPQTANKILNWMHKIHNSTMLNRIISIPLKSVWFRFYFRDTFQNPFPKIFIFHASYYWLRQNDYFLYLKKKYPSCKIVFVLMDTVDSYIRYFRHRFKYGFDLDYIKKNFDLVLTYNKLDAKSFDLLYYPSIYSEIKMYNYNENFDIDVFFVGRAKDRLSDIYEAYDILKSKGFNCEFFLFDVDDKSQKKQPDIHYNEYLSYFEVLSYVKHSRGILEIVQKKSSGFTFRINEALSLDKNIITNNPIVDDFLYSESKKIFKVHALNEIDLNIYRKEALNSYKYKDDYSPQHFLSFVSKIVK